MRVEVFATNVEQVSQAAHLIEMLHGIFPDYLINFDLDDCDRILRVESDQIDTKEIVRLLNSNEVECKTL